MDASNARNWPVVRPDVQSYDPYLIDLYQLTRALYLMA